MLVGKVVHKMANRPLTPGFGLSAQFAARMVANAKRRQGRRARERPDDREPIQPAEAKQGEPENEEGDQESKLNGARLDEMLKLAGGNEVGA